MIFRLNNLGKEFSGSWLFRGLSVQCNTGSRVGLIGRNGTGKTTLFNLIDGRMVPDEGQVVRSSQITISRIDQLAVLDQERTVYETAVKAFDDLKRLEHELSELQLEISSQEGDIQARKAEEYERLQSRFDFYGGYEYESRTEKVLFGLGFSKEELKAPCGHLSGGQQSRLLLAGALLRPAELLLLDEPTNHLDLDGIIWLTELLKNHKSAMVLISHDREFLDAVTNSTWELEGGELRHYPASFSASRRLRKERNRLQEQEYQQQQEWKRKTEEFIRRNIVGQKTKQAQARRRQLENTLWIAPPSADEVGLKMKIPEARRGGALSFQVSEGVIGFERQPLIHDTEIRVMRGERIGILGGNGSGKTTLLKTVLGETKALKGRVQWGDNNVPAYFAQETGSVNEADTVLEYLAKVNPTWTDLELRSFAATFLFRADDTSKTLGMLSGGERSRLHLARLFSRPSNVLLLDEPTNHLDIRSREALEKALRAFTGTVLVISHDLYFLREVVDRFYLIRQGKLHLFDRMEELRSELFALPNQKALISAPAEKSSRVKFRSGLSKNERMRREQRMEKLEARIEELEKEKTQIEDQLQTGSSEHTLLNDLALRHRKIEVELAQLFEDWSRVGSELQD